ncbi:hypothetical protein QYF36_024788 [Acer negundo]|nr:hypothetical protein QYF36_024788 [Acer negundo]
MMEFEDISRKCEKLSLDEEDGPVKRISGSLQEKGKQRESGECVGKFIRIRVIVDITIPLKRGLRVALGEDEKMRAASMTRNKDIGGHKNNPIGYRQGGSSDNLGENQRKESSGRPGPEVNNQDSMTVIEGRENLRLQGASNWNAKNESRALLRDDVDSVSTTIIKSGNLKLNRSVSETLEANRKEQMQNVMTPNKEKITESGMQNPTRMEIIEGTSNPVSSENVLIQEEAARLEDSR